MSTSTRAGGNARRDPAVAGSLVRGLGEVERQRNGLTWYRECWEARWAVTRRAQVKPEGLECYLAGLPVPS
jgi:hypothetical protein